VVRPEPLPEGKSAEPPFFMWEGSRSVIETPTFSVRPLTQLTLQPLPSGGHLPRGKKGEKGSFSRAPTAGDRGRKGSVGACVT
jgi:hypothetical protein